MKIIKKTFKKKSSTYRYQKSKISIIHIEIKHFSIPENFLNPSELFSIAYQITFRSYGLNNF